VSNASNALLTQESPSPLSAAGSPRSFWQVRVGIGRRLGQLGWAGWLVLIAMLVGAILRLVNLAGVPPGFHQDEAAVAIDAYSLLHTARDHLGHPLNLMGFESFGDFPPPVPVLLSIPFIALFGLKVWSARAATAIVGVLLIPIIYALGRRLFDRKAIGVTAAWLVALMPWHIIESRVAIQPSVVPTVTAVIMLGLVWTARQQSDWAAIATAVATAAGIATYHALRVQVPLLVLVALIAFGPQLIRVRRSILAVSALIVALVAIPTAVFVLVDKAGGARMRQVSVFAHNPPHLPPGTKVDFFFIVGQYLGYFSPNFLFRSGDGIPQLMLLNTGVLPISWIPLLLIGIGALLWAIARPSAPWHRQRALFLLLTLVIYPVPGFLTLPSPLTARALHVIPLIALIAAVGACTIADLIARLLRRTRAGRNRATIPLVILLTLVIFAAEAASQLRDYFQDYPNQVEVRSLFQYGIEGPINYAIAHRTEYDQIWITNTNQPYIYVLFFGDWRVEDFQGRLVVQRNPPYFNSVLAFKNFRFPQGNRSGPPADIQPANLAPLFATTYPSGQVAYAVRGGNVPGRGRVLLIYRP
jgi:4-amino-4-deoxy-L-arabinose transferase-like glycosyltransferase